MATKTNQKSSKKVKNNKSINAVTNLTPKTAALALVVIIVFSTVGVLGYNKVKYGSFTASAAGWTTWVYFGSGTSTINKGYTTGSAYLTRGT